MKPRHAHGAELEAYLVYTNPIPRAEIEVTLPGLRLEAFPYDPDRVRSVRLTGDADPGEALSVLRRLLLSGSVRWLELGFRAYSLIEGKREYRPWRRNTHLSLEAFEALATLEPEVRYHAPI